MKTNKTPPYATTGEIAKLAGVPRHRVKIRAPQIPGAYQLEKTRNWLIPGDAVKYFKNPDSFGFSKIRSPSEKIPYITAGELAISTGLSRCQASVLAKTIPGAYQLENSRVWIIPYTGIKYLKDNPRYRSGRPKGVKDSKSRMKRSIKSTFYKMCKNYLKIWNDKINKYLIEVFYRDTQ